MYCSGLGRLSVGGSTGAGAQGWKGCRQDGRMELRREKR